MIDVNWDLAPEGAEKIIQLEDTITWAKGGHYWSVASDNWEADVCENENIVIATRPTQTKTVADAVEYYKENGKICGYSFSENKMLSFCKSNGTYFFVSDKSSAGSVETDDWQPICTREQFEAYVKEQEAKQEGEKWTHVTSVGKVRCKIIQAEPDFNGYIVAFNDLEEYQLIEPEHLKPIKPTISEDAKRQLELYVQYRFDKYGNYDMKSDLSDYLSHHEII